MDGGKAGLTCHSLPFDKHRVRTEGWARSARPVGAVRTLPKLCFGNRVNPEGGRFKIEAVIRVFSQSISANKGAMAAVRTKLPFKYLANQGTEI